MVIVLEVEDITKKSLFHFHKKIITPIKNPSVLILMWSTLDENKKKKYEMLISDYFLKLGVCNIVFLKEDDLGFEDKFAEANILYLPGGNVRVFLEKLNERPEIIESIKNFKGIIIGNSAGAMILSRKGMFFDNDEEIILDGLGVTEYSIVVHYNERNFNKIKKAGSCICLYEDSGIVLKGNCITEFCGQILLIKEI